jgi:hypothetical protein
VDSVTEDRRSLQKNDQLDATIKQEIGRHDHHDDRGGFRWCENSKPLEPSGWPSY